MLFDYPDNLCFGYNHRRTGCRTLWFGTGRARQRNPSQKTSHRRGAPCPEARDVPGSVGRGISEPKPEILRRSPPQGRKTAQCHHHRRRRKARHHRARPVQQSSEMDRRSGVKDTVARKNETANVRPWNFTSIRSRGRSVYLKLTINVK